MPARLLDLKLELGEGELRRLIAVCYELAVRPPMAHAPTLQRWAALLVRLLKLPAVHGDLALELEWRPLFGLVQDYLYRPAREARLYADEACIKAVLRLAEKARRHFGRVPIEEELAGLVQPLRARSLSQYVALLSIFLPNAQIGGGLLALLHPATGALWATGSRRIEALNMLLVMRATKCSQLAVDWDAWAPLLFNVLRRHLKLPGGEAGPKAAVAKYGPDDKPGNRLIRSIHADFVQYFAKWLVRAMADGNGLLAALEAYLQSVDTFFHPSNGGSWSAELSHLLHCLVEAMNKRLHRRKRAYTLAPLSAATLARFAGALWPAVSKLVFSKNFMGTLGAQEVVKGLVNLAPALVLAQVPAIVEPSLQSLTEPHRTSASIGLLGATARKMVDQAAYPGGVALAIGFLHAVLPGIDSNDPLKTISTLSFLSSAFMVLPIADISLSAVASDDPAVTANAEATASFEAFVVLFLEQCFHFLTCIPRPNDKDTGASPETGIQNLLLNSLDVFFMQLSAPLTQVALARTLAFLRADSHLYAAAAVGHLVGKLCSRFPAATAPRVLDAVLPEAAALAERHVGLDEEQTDEYCTRLIYLLHVLRRTLQCAQGVCAAHAAPLAAFLAQTLRCHQKTVALLAAQTFKAWVKAAAMTYPLEWSSAPPGAVSLADYGRLYRAAEVTVAWHRPAPADVAWCVERCEAQLAGVAAVPVLRTRLIHLRNLLKACWVVRQNFGGLAGGCAAPDAEARLDAVVAAVVAQLLAVAPALGTVELKRLHVDAVAVALNHRGITAERYGSLKRGVAYLKSALSAFKKDALKPRYWIVKRAFLQHLCRVEKAVWGAPATTPQHAALLGLLLGYSVAPFPELAGLAQAELATAARCEGGAMRALLRTWVGQAADPAVDEDTLKAILSLRGSAMNLALASDWALLHQFLAWLTALNDRPDIGRIPQIHEHITGLFIETARGLTGPPGAAAPNAVLARVLGVRADGAAAYNHERERQRAAIVALLVGRYGGATWRSQIMISTYALILLTQQDAVAPAEALLFLSGAASDVVDVRFSALQGAKLALHLWNTQGARGALVLEPELLLRVLRCTEMEEHEDGAKLDFRPDTCRLVQSLTDIQGPGLLSLLAQHMEAARAPWSAGRQRAFAEWLGGFLRSAAYTQAPDAFAALFAEGVEPLVRLCWANCGVDAAKYWYAAFFFCVRDRPAEHAGVLFRFLEAQLRATLDRAGASNLETTLVVVSLSGLVRGASLAGAGRLAGLIQARLFETPFLLVRREAAALLRELVRSAAGGAGPPPGLETAAGSPERVKALVELAHSAIGDPVLAGVWRHATELLPVFLAAHRSDEIELQLATRSVVRRLAWADYCPSRELLLELLGRAQAVARSDAFSIHVRKLAIEAMVLLLGRNYPLCGEADLAGGYLEACFALLEDASVEIREAAAPGCSALFHIRPAIADAWGVPTARLLEAQLADLRLERALHTRHGLCLRAYALLQSAPYRVPAWAPQLMVQLARYLPDRAPVAGTVRKAFAEFKKTHMDNWAVEREAFTEEELEAISELLVAPSYYA